MKVNISLSELATQIEAQLTGAEEEIWVNGVSTLKHADKKAVSFFVNAAYREELANTQAAAVILAPKDQVYCQVPSLVMANPYLGYARATALFNPPVRKKPGIHPTAWVSTESQIDVSASIGAQAVVEAGCQIGADVQIGAGCVIAEGVQIGKDSQLVANVTVCQGTRIGQRVLIHPGAVIGADGFGFANDNGQWFKIPQLGSVLIEDDVEIGANTTIDRGALEDTYIATGVKIDNQVQIAHNVHIGAYTAIAGCVGIAGSTHIGQYCMIAGGVGIVGHIKIVDNVHITGGSMVLQSILTAGVFSSGTPLESNRRWHRNYHRFKQLDELAKRLQQLEQKIK